MTHKFPIVLRNTLTIFSVYFLVNWGEISLCITVVILGLLSVVMLSKDKSLTFLLLDISLVLLVIQVLGLILLATIQYLVKAKLMLHKNYEDSKLKKGEE